MPTRTTVTKLLDRLAAPLEVGGPDIAGPLAVFPVFGAEPRTEYLSFAEAASHGFQVTELPGRASVGDLRVVNPTASAVLLYEGEEVLGAQQNRTLDTHVLVAAGAKLTVPVSCVEQGRWDGRRHGQAFTPSPQAAYPKLRQRKNRALRERMATGAEARADQGEVWAEVADRADRLQACAPTRAMSDVYEDRRDALAEIRSAVTRRAGQVGALGAIGGRLTVLDCVSRPDVYAALHGPLVEGYALDALGRPDAAPPSRDEAAAWLEALLAARPQAAPTPGLGETLHFRAARGAGTGLTHEGELVAVCAFAG